MVKSGKSMSIAVSMRISVELRAAMARERILKQGGSGRPEKKEVQPGCERLHNVWRTHPQPPNPQSEMGTLATATHSERTFDSLPLVHVEKFMKTWYKWYNHVWPKTSKNIFPANTLLNSGCQGAMPTWSYASRGSLGQGSICDSGISASEAALGVGELGEPLRTVCSSCLHVVTAMNLWQLMIRQPCTARLE